jgi:four helix bundle protein
LGKRKRSKIQRGKFQKTNSKGENLGRQDLIMHLKISRKEAKETQYWLELIITEDEVTRISLKKEAEEIRRIFSAIINKIQG